MLGTMLRLFAEVLSDHAVGFQVMRCEWHSKGKQPPQLGQQPLPVNGAHVMIAAADATRPGIIPNVEAKGEVFNHCPVQISPARYSWS